MTSETVWWVEGLGARRRISAAGLLVGRAPECDVLLEDTRASRKQALVYVDREVPRLLVLGRGKTRVGERSVAKESELQSGDVVHLPGIELTISSSEEVREGDTSAGGWLLRGPQGAVFGVVKSPFLVGGDEADLHVAGLPARAFELLLQGDGLVLRAHGLVTVDDVALEPGNERVLAAGSDILCGDAMLSVVPIPIGAVSSTLSPTLGSIGVPGNGLTKAVLQFLPRGGRFTVTVDGSEYSVYLPDRRCDLIATLLSPPDAVSPGEFLDDEALITRVWPGRVMSRSDLNVLVHRVRKSLASAGLDGGALLQRAKGGGGTRLVLAPGARVVLD